MFVDEAILQRGYEYVEKYGACVAGMPSKDTVKMVDEETFCGVNSGTEICMDGADTSGV